MWSQVRAKEHSSTSVWPQGESLGRRVRWVEGHACSWARLSAQPTGFLSLPVLPGATSCLLLRWARWGYLEWKGYYEFLPF